MHWTLVQQKTANDAMFNGDPQPYMAMWSHADDVSVFGAWGPCKVGWPALSKTFEWVGSRFSNGDMEFDVQVGERFLRRVLDAEHGVAARPPDHARAIPAGAGDRMSGANSLTGGAITQHCSSTAVPSGRANQLVNAHPPAVRDCVGIA